MNKNKLGGLQYENRADQRRAQKADLITIGVKGTNCGNCVWRGSWALGETSKYCQNPLVQLPVNEKMCCCFWAGENQIESWR